MKTIRGLDIMKRRRSGSSRTPSRRVEPRRSLGDVQTDLLEAHARIKELLDEFQGILDSHGGMVRHPHAGAFRVTRLSCVGRGWVSMDGRRVRKGGGALCLPVIHIGTAKQCTLLQAFVSADQPQTEDDGRGLMEIAKRLPGGA